jgi:endoglucanase
MRATLLPLRASALAIAATFVASSAGAQATPAIHLSQIGFVPNVPKVAVVVAASASAFAIVDAARGDTVLRGSLTPPKPWALSGEENVRRAEFGTLTRPGRYRVVVPGVATSPEFEIGTTPLHDLAVATL